MSHVLDIIPLPFPNQQAGQGPGSPPSALSPQLQLQSPRFPHLKLFCPKGRGREHRMNLVSRRFPLPLRPGKLTPPQQVSREVWDWTPGPACARGPPALWRGSAHSPARARGLSCHGSPASPQGTKPSPVQMDVALPGRDFLGTSSSPFVLPSPDNPPTKAHDTRFFFGGGVRETPCIRKLDTEFCYIGILYIC